MVQVRGNRVCFTLNNFTSEEQQAFVEYCNESETRRGLTYGVAGEEIGDETGVHHLQGFIHLAGSSVEGRKRGVRFWKTIPGLGRAHFETAKGSDGDSRVYCTKDGIYQEWGTPGTASGGVYGTMLDKIREGTLEDAVAHDPELAIKHFGSLKGLHDLLCKDVPVQAPTELWDWQVCFRAKGTLLYYIESSLLNGMFIAFAENSASYAGCTRRPEGTVHRGCPRRRRKKYSMQVSHQGDGSLGLSRRLCKGPHVRIQHESNRGLL